MRLTHSVITTYRVVRAASSVVRLTKPSEHERIWYFVDTSPTREGTRGGNLYTLLPKNESGFHNRQQSTSEVKNDTQNRRYSVTYGDILAGTHGRLKSLKVRLMT